MDEAIVAQRNAYADDGDGTHTQTITRRSGEQYIITIDSEDVPQLRRHVWRIQTGTATKNVVRGVGGVVTFMSHQIAGKPDAGLLVYHHNNDPMDCRKSNLKVGNRSDLSKNNRLVKAANGTAKYWFFTTDQRWLVFGLKDHQSIYVGCYTKRKDAKAAADKWTAEHKGAA